QAGVPSDAGHRAWASRGVPHGRPAPQAVAAPARSTPLRHGIWPSTPAGRRPAPDVSRRAAAGVITSCDHRSPGTSPCEGFFEKLFLLPLAEAVVQIGKGATHHKAG